MASNVPSEDLWSTDINAPTRVANPIATATGEAADSTRVANPIEHQQHHQQTHYVPEQFTRPVGPPSLLIRMVPDRYVRTLLNIYRQLSNIYRNISDIYRTSIEHEEIHR